MNASHHRSFRDGSKAVDEDVTGDIDWRTWKRQNSVTLAYVFVVVMFSYSNDNVFQRLRPVIKAAKRAECSHKPTSARSFHNVP